MPENWDLCVDGVKLWGERRECEVEVEDVTTALGVGGSDWVVGSEVVGGKVSELDNTKGLTMSTERSVDDEPLRIY